MKKIGLAGFGFIGQFLYERLAGRTDVEVAAVWDMDSTKTAGLDPKKVCAGAEDLGSRSLDLLVEVAHPKLVHSLWPNITSSADLMIASMTSMADSKFQSRIRQEAREQGKKIFLPHGAVLGLDGLRDGRALLESVTITTTKHPINLGLTDTHIKKPQIMFEGSTRDACIQFPRNVNVHAAFALAGLGFEATRSVVVADPDSRKMHHRIEVRGRGLSWNLEIESFSAGQVTGSYTPESLYQSLVGILFGRGEFCIV